MPEGDSIHHAARRVRAAVGGTTPERVETRHPRTRGQGWEKRLKGRAVEEVGARGKWLWIAFEGDLAVLSHLRMTGKWEVVPHGQRFRRRPWRSWLVLGSGRWDAGQFDGPILELVTRTRLRGDQRLRALGPDVCAPEPFDEQRFLRRLREDDPTRPFGDALLDQRIVAGIGNVWKSETCFLSRIDPWRPSGEVGDEEAVGAVTRMLPLIRKCAEQGTHLRPKDVYGRTGMRCRRCGGEVQGRHQGDDNRSTFWCGSCQS